MNVRSGRGVLRAVELVVAARTGVSSVPVVSAVARVALGFTRWKVGLEGPSAGLSQLSMRHTSATVPCKRAWRASTASGLLSSSDGSL